MTRDVPTSDVPKPFLRWAGGKNWLANRLKEIFPDLRFNHYHEPFLGGASVFFSLACGRKAYLSDKNKALIDTYRCVRDTPEKVIRVMKTFKNESDYYYNTRNHDFNNGYERAAQFIYLNQTSFNGIYRVNLNGIYNVPFGNRTKTFLNERNIMGASQALKTTVLNDCDFFDCIDNIRKGDLVFIDPPYTVSHNKNGFIKYNEILFSLEDQYRLASFIEDVKSRNAHYILTNAAHQKIDDIFLFGDTRIELMRASLIGGLKAKRGHVSEYMFTNMETN